MKVLGEHQAYWETCAGSLAVLFAKPPARQEVVCDLYGLVVNLAQVVQDDELAVRLYDRLQRTAFCESLYREATESLVGVAFKADDKPDLDAAYD